MIYLRARYYSPAVQRFISQDLIKDGLNWYVYCGNNPNYYIDPTGLSSRVNLQSISDQFSSGLLTDEQVTEKLLEANGGNVYLAFHEIAQVHIARQLKNSLGANDVVLEYPISYYVEMRGGTVKRNMEADIVSGGAVWEVKPLGTSGEEQLEKYMAYGNLTRGTPLCTIVDIPILDDIKMKIEFPNSGDAKYSFYTLEDEPEGSQVAYLPPVVVKRKIDLRRNEQNWNSFKNKTSVLVNEALDTVEPYAAPIISFVFSAAMCYFTGIWVPA